MKTPVIATSTKYGIDKACYNLSVLLDAALTWLDYAFGASEILTTKTEEKDQIYPVCYVNNQYDLQSVLPDDRWGIYCFWTYTEGKADDKDFGMSHSPRMTYDAAVIFYGDLTKVSTSADHITTKGQVRAQIMGALTRKCAGFGGVLSVSGITEDWREVFKGYTFDTPVVMPKFCMKINVTISILEDCL